MLRQFLTYYYYSTDFTTSHTDGHRGLSSIAHHEILDTLFINYVLGLRSTHLMSFILQNIEDHFPFCHLRKLSNMFS